MASPLWNHGKPHGLMSSPLGLMASQTGLMAKTNGQPLDQFGSKKFFAGTGKRQGNQMALSPALSLRFQVAKGPATDYAESEASDIYLPEGTDSFLSKYLCALLKACQLGP